MRLFNEGEYSASPVVMFSEVKQVYKEGISIDPKIAQAFFALFLYSEEDLRYMELLQVTERHNVLLPTNKSTIATPSSSNNIPKDTTFQGRLPGTSEQKNYYFCSCNRSASSLGESILEVSLAYLFLSAC